MVPDLKTGVPSAEGEANIKIAAEQVFTSFSVPLFSRRFFSIV
jgi:hypothetical protein